MLRFGTLVYTYLLSFVSIDIFLKEDDFIILLKSLNIFLLGFKLLGSVFKLFDVAS